MNSLLWRTEIPLVSTKIHCSARIMLANLAKVFNLMIMITHHHVI